MPLKKHHDEELIENYNLKMLQYTRGKPPPLHTPSVFSGKRGSHHGALTWKHH